jgi:hypothetical protein
MRRRCVSHRCGNLRLVTGLAPLACDLRLCGDASLHAIDLPQPPLGDPRRLRPPAKHEGCSLRVSGGVKNPKTRLVGVVMGTLHDDPKAHPQQIMLHICSCMPLHVSLALY